MRFEIKRIDGSARTGKFGEFETPAIIHHEEIRGFLERADVEIPKILPPFSVPPSEELPEKLLHPRKIEFVDSQLVVMCASGYLDGKGRELFETMEKVKRELRPNTAIYLPALATPENISILFFLGADFFDDLRCLSSAMNGEYLTREGSFKISEIENLPCSCPVCSSHSAEELRDDWKLLHAHNFNALWTELETAKMLFRKGMLREYISKQCRNSPWLTVALRLYDESEFYKRRVPVRRASKFYANSSDELRRAEIRRFAERVLERWTPKSKILLLLPCSARKPYSLSQTHQRISKALGPLRRCADELIITSPLGIVPRFLETVYPAMHYDIPVTGRWDEEEKKWASELLREFSERYGYERILAYLSGDYLEVCRLAEIEIEYFSSLEELREELEKEIELQRPPSMKRYLMNHIISIADYQFGRGWGERIAENAEIRGKYPRLEVISEGRALCSIQEDGLLTLTLRGAERLKGNEGYTVLIDDFIPSGSILSPGIIEAGEEILPGDDVLFENSRVFGVGRALMCSEDMMKCSYGVAIAVRGKVVRDED
ncbi:MAG: DUF5591 domain-containing protein [Archaeoglobi archaeon]|nr:DUF5591 domain-containing protein [Candidatus Mnemosynella bozhongmuii]